MCHWLRWNNNWRITGLEREILIFLKVETIVCLNAQKYAHERKTLPFTSHKSTLTSEDYISDIQQAGKAFQFIVLCFKPRIYL